MRVTNYDLGGVLRNGDTTTVYRAWHVPTGTSRILKMLRPEKISPGPSNRLRYEYAAVRSVNHPVIVKALEFIEEQGNLGIAFEDIGGVAIRDAMGGSPLAVSLCLDVGRQIAAALRCLHEARIIHKDVSPHNIVLNRDSCAIQLIDLGISSQLTREHVGFDSVGTFEGTLAFMSPEQTGRLNRSLDARTDLYSLGATLYLLLTGRLPFEQSDTLDLLHAVLAREPEPPHLVNPGLPRTVSRIVVRLMAKGPEERYQSAFGAWADLERACSQLSETGNVEPFELASQDRNSVFAISEKVYGRQSQRQALLHALDRVSRDGQTEIVLVAGRSGEGKSVLVNELQEPVTRSHAFFGRGKYDVLRSNVPYSAVTDAIHDVIAQILRRPERQVGQIRNMLRGALGGGAAALAQMVPHIELLLGPQGNVNELGPREEQARFFVLLQEMLRVLARPEHPLVLFLDDLQWADKVSLDLLDELLARGIPYLLILGAYRVNEVDAAHRLSTWMGGLHSDGVAITEIEVSPLNQQDVHALLADTLRTTNNELESLAAVVLQKTGGNPFYIHQFLQHLHQQGLFTFAAEVGSWQWNAVQIERSSVTTNVLEVLANRVRMVDSATQNVLMIAATLGRVFDLRIVALASQQTVSEAAKVLWNAVQQGIIEPLGDGYKFPEATVEAGDPVLYRFAHDSLMECAASMHDAATLPQWHFAIGALLLAHLTPAEREANLFILTNLLNADSSQGSQEQQDQLFELNYQAGKRARSANSLDMALDYFNHASELLPQNAWGTVPDVWFALHLDMAECEDLTGNTSAAHRRIEMLLQHGTNEKQYLDLQARRCRLLMSQNRLDEGVALVREVFARMQFVIPHKVSAARVFLEWLRVGRLLGSEGERLPTELPLSLPPHLAPLRQMAHHAALAMFQVDPVLSAWFGLRLLRHDLEGSVVADTGSYLIHFSTASIVFLRRMEQGKRVEKRSLELTARGNPAEVGRHSTLLSYTAATAHFSETLASVSARAEEGMRVGIEIGALDGAFRCSAVAVAVALQQGGSLASLHERIEGFMQIFAGREEPISLEVMLEYRQAIRCLRGETRDRQSFEDDDYDETRHFEHMRSLQGKGPLCDYYRLKLHVACIHHDWPAAERHARAARPLIQHIIGMAIYQQFHFHEALAAAMLLGSEANAGRKWRLGRATRELKSWALGNQANFGGDYDLVRAVTQWHAGNTTKSAQLFEDALRRYLSMGNLEKIGLTHELYARMRLSEGLHYAAAADVRAAQSAYVAWGALPKAEALRFEFPTLLDDAEEQRYHTTAQTTSVSSSTSRGTSRDLELGTIVKAWEKLSGESTYDGLAKELLRHIVTYSGGDHGILMVRRDGALRLAHKIWLDDQSGRQSVNDTALPNQILRAAERSKQPLNIGDISKEVDFSKEQYTLARGTRSVLCVPILFNNEVKGLVYVENRLLAHAFSLDRVQVVQMLAAQAAVSLENASFYEDLNRQVEERTREARLAQAQLVELEKESTEQQMAGGFAHEMRNALSAAKNVLEAASEGITEQPMAQFQEALLREPAFADHPLLKNSLNELTSAQATMREIIDLTNESVERALRVTAMIMDYARLGKTRRGSDAVHTGQLAERIVTEAKVEMLRLGIELRAAVRGSHVFYGSEAHFYSIMRNLINNARDAFVEQPNERPRRIDVVMEEDGAQVILRVTDNGAGMPPDVQKRIFEPFFSTKPTTGLGLGLSMVKKLVALYDGEIAVSSSAGEGTTFTITFPMA